MPNQIQPLILMNPVQCSQHCLKHLRQAAYHSYLGLRATYRDELAFRIELFLSIFLFPLAFVIGQTLGEQVLLIGSWFFVLLIELLNTAIEAIIDRIGPELHPESGKAKDIGSALVFISALQAALFWGILGIRWLLSQLH